MHEKSALESYWTVNPLSLFFFFLVNLLLFESFAD